jgi:hypothetical protein
LSMRCLVLEAVRVVAEDLALLIDESRAGTGVVVTGTLAEAEATLDTGGGFDVAFLNTETVCRDLACQEAGGIGCGGRLRRP